MTLSPSQRNQSLKKRKSLEKRRRGRRRRRVKRRRKPGPVRRELKMRSGLLQIIFQIIFLIWSRLSSSYDHEYLPHMITHVLLLACHLWIQGTVTHSFICCISDFTGQEEEKRNGGRFAYFFKKEAVKLLKIITLYLKWFRIFWGKNWSLVWFDGAKISCLVLNKNHCLTLIPSLQ